MENKNHRTLGSKKGFAIAQTLLSLKTKWRLGTGRGIEINNTAWFPPKLNSSQLDSLNIH